MRTGVVSEFDEAKGFGTVSAEGEDRFFFHCTQIADGTRDIEVGTSVSFELAPRLGRWEAVELNPR